jgi:hypothetical protein
MPIKFETFHTEYTGYTGRTPVLYIFKKTNLFRKYWGTIRHIWRWECALPELARHSAAHCHLWTYDSNSLWQSSPVPPYAVMWYVTIEGVRIDNRIYWTLTLSYKLHGSKYAINLSFRCLHRLSPGNASKRRKFLSFCVPLLRSSLDGACLNSLCL